MKMLKIDNMLNKLKAIRAEVIFNHLFNYYPDGFYNNTFG